MYINPAHGIDKIPPVGLLLGMESIIEYLKRKLKDVGPSRWELIADAAGVAKTLPRKLAYDTTRENPGVQTIQPLIDYFNAVERGERELPELATTTKQAV